MKTIYFKHKLWIVVILWMILIFCLSAQTASESSSLSGQTIRKVVVIVQPAFQKMKKLQQDNLISDLQHIARKTTHVLIYMVLGVLCMTALLQYLLKMKICFITTLVICTSYATSDELHQLFVNGRGAQIIDICIDVSGALLGILFVMLIHWVWNRRCKLRMQVKNRP